MPIVSFLVIYLALHLDVSRFITRLFVGCGIPPQPSAHVAILIIFDMWTARGRSHDIQHYKPARSWPQPETTNERDVIVIPAPGRQLGVLAKQSTKFRLGSETVTKVISHDSGLLHVYPTAFHRQDDWP